MKNTSKLALVLSLFCLTTMISCVRPNPRHYGSPPPGDFSGQGDGPGYSVGHPGYATHGHGHPSKHHASSGGGQRKIIEHGRAGYLLVERNADGTPTGRTMFSKEKRDEVDGAPVHHHEPKRMHVDKLKAILAEIDEY